MVLANCFQISSCRHGESTLFTCFSYHFEKCGFSQRFHYVGMEKGWTEDWSLLKISSHEEMGKNMSDDNGIEILKKLKQENRKEDERFKDMTSALLWLKSQLKTLKEEDKKLMKKFRDIRTQINTIKDIDECGEPSRTRGSSLLEIYHEEDETFAEAQRANYHPFDEEPDDGKSLRRRALSMQSET